MAATTITLLNKKGGVGKTTTTCNLGAALALRGRRVLLIDNDPQASLTEGIFGDATVDALAVTETVYALYSPECDPDPSEVVRNTPWERVSMVPGSLYADAFNFPFPDAQPIDRQMALKRFIAEVDEDYDLILIDCPPNLYLCSWAALTASDAIIIPVQPENHGARGIPACIASIAAVRGHTNPALETLGYAISMIEARKSTHQAFVNVIRATYGEAVFETTIPRTADVIDSTAYFQPVLSYKRGRGVTSQAYLGLADEVIARVAELGSTRRREVL